MNCTFDSKVSNIDPFPNGTEKKQEISTFIEREPLLNIVYVCTFNILKTIGCAVVRDVVFKLECDLDKTIEPIFL